MLRAQLAPHHNAGERRELQRRDEVAQRAPVQHFGESTLCRRTGIHARSKEIHRLTPASEFAVQSVMQRHRRRPATDIEEAAAVGVARGGDGDELQAELVHECMHCVVVGVDELCAALTPLAVREAVAPHPPADPIPRLQHQHIAARCDQIGCGVQTGEAGADHHDIDPGHTRARRHLSDLPAQNSVGCSGRMRRRPGQGT